MGSYDLITKTLFVQYFLLRLPAPFHVDLALEIYCQYNPPSDSAKLVYQVDFPVPPAKPSVFHSKIVSQDQSPSLLHRN